MKCAALEEPERLTHHLLRRGVQDDASKYCCLVASPPLQGVGQLEELVVQPAKGDGARISTRAAEA